MAKERITILGGGIAALTAAFELTRTPDWQDRFEVTGLPDGLAVGR